MSDTSVPIGGDFSRIFDHRDYLAMVSIPDDATCILRAHLVLEEVLNVWSSKLTSTDDLYCGGFVAFKTKLVISRNLGLDKLLFEILNRINDLRNRFSHRKGYALEYSAIDALRKLVDSFPSQIELGSCESYQTFIGGTDSAGKKVETTYSWASAGNRIKFVIVFIVLMLKVTHWIQGEFIKRGIRYTIVAT